MRKILINYPKRQVGNKMYGGESSHLPLKINTAGVIPAIFASALYFYPLQFQILDLQVGYLFESFIYVYTGSAFVYVIICIRNYFLCILLYVNSIQSKRNRRKFKKVWWIYTWYKTRRKKQNILK